VKMGPGCPPTPEPSLEEYERVLERVAAIDVAMASGMVCTRVPHEDPARAGASGAPGCGRWMPPRMNARAVKNERAGQAEDGPVD